MPKSKPPQTTLPPAGSRQTPLRGAGTARPELVLGSASPVLVLAGGLGTRLRSVHGPRQKVLASVGGRPFLERLLDQIEMAGFRDVVLCTGFRGEEVEQAIGTRFGTLRISYAREEVPLGTAGALRWAAERVTGDRVLAINGDSYCDVDLRSFDAWARARQSDAALVVTRVPDLGRYGAVEMEGERVRSFREKGRERGEGWINAGIYSFRRGFLTSLPRSGPLSLEHDVFERRLASGLFAYPHEGSFLDIGTPESLDSASAFFVEGD